VPAPQFCHFARFICRNREQPRPHPIGLAQVPEMAPRLYPRPLRGLLSHISVATHRVTNSQQVGVVSVDQFGEGTFVSQPG